jgi:dipeptide transport system substrate-binding protein
VKRSALFAAICIPAMLAAASVSAKTLVFCSEGNPENFGPGTNTTGTTFDAISPIYDNIVEFKKGSTEVAPALAEKWDVSSDGLTYTFHLRKGVKWHTPASSSYTTQYKPTRDFNADDVLFTFNRAWKADHPFHKVSGGDYAYFNDMAFPTLLKSIDKVDDYTVRFVLNQPNAPFLADLAMNFASIQSAEYGDFLIKQGKPELMDQEPIGTGPYQFVEYKKDALIRYKAFPGFWNKGEQKLDGVVFSITPDAAVRYAKLQKNECQIMVYPNPADLEKISKDPVVNLLKQPGLNIAYLAMNNTKKPFDDKRVRQAVQYAIDKKNLVQTVYKDSGVPAVNLIPPTIWSYNKSVKDYPFDQNKAKQLLSEAGVKDGFETDLWYMPVQRPYNPNGKAIAELMQADLAKVGIKANLKTFEWGEYRKRMQAGEDMMGQLGWTGDNGDPDNFLNVLSGCPGGKPGSNNLSKWCNDQFNELLTKALTLTNQGERTKLYEKAQEIFHEEAPVFLIAHSIVNQPVRKEVEGFKISPFGRNEFRGVSLK